MGTRAKQSLFGRVAAAAKYVATGRPQTNRPRASLDAGRSSRRLKPWNPSEAELNTLMRGSGSMVVRRARQLAQETCYGASAQEAWTASVIGTGIRPSCMLEDPYRKLEVQQLWRRWMTVADSSASTNFYGLQMQVANALFTDGEAFVRRRPRFLRDGLPVPMQLQVLEADHVDRAYTAALPNGHQVRSGIEFDAIGRRVGYWMWRNHPGDSTVLVPLQERVFVPARDVLHVYYARRPGQIRGFPRITPAIIPMHELDDYDDAELARKKTTAMLAAFVTDNDVESEGETGNLVGEGDVDSDGIATAEWEPGTIMVLGSGQDVTVASPSDVGGNYDTYQKRQLTKISAGMGLSYSQVTADVSQANYSSERAAQVQLRRRITPQQLVVMVDRMVRPVWEWFVADAVLSGALEGYDVDELQQKVAYILPKWEWVDPLKDRKAEQLAVDNLWKSRSDVIEAEGMDPSEVDQRIAQDQEREERLELRRGAQGAQAGDDVDEMIAEEERQEDNRRLQAHGRDFA